MKDLVLDIMDKSEDIDFILSKDTAYEVALTLLDDGRVFEEMEEFEVIEEINNSVAVIVSQILTDEGYIYILENYLFNNGTAKGMDSADLVVIEDEIEDLVDMDKIYSEVDIPISFNDMYSCKEYKTLANELKELSDKLNENWAEIDDLSIDKYIDDQFDRYIKDLINKIN